MRRIPIIVLLLLHSHLFAQLAVSGIPKSFKILKKSAISISETNLPYLDSKKLIETDSAEGIDNRFAVAQYVDINLKRDGLKTEIPNEGNIWQYLLTSANAYSLGIAFTEYRLPKGASVFIYSPDHSKILGAFTEQNNNENNYLQVAELFEKQAIVEYFEPLDAEFLGMLSIGNISMAYRDIQNIVQTSNLDINCPGWEKLQTVKKAICRMIYRSGTDYYYCSGALLNNTAFNLTPYFLTAAHCISTSDEALSLVTYFNYESLSCGSSSTIDNMTLSGAKLLSTSGSSDCTLLLLNDVPPKSYSAYYAGWNVSGNATDVSYGIHHPAGKIKSGAYSSVKPITFADYINWDKGPVSPANTHWLVNFSKGLIEGGSSGSPLLNSNLQVIGQLHGGGETTNYYGKLSESWKLIPLANWLDPEHTGTKLLEGTAGYVIPKAGFLVYPATSCTNGTITLTDTSKYSPTSWLWTINSSDTNYEFSEGTNETTTNPKLKFKSAGTYEIKLLATNQYGKDSVSSTINVVDNLDVNINFPEDTNICGCDLKSILIKASGAANYIFSLTSTALVDTTTDNSKLYLTIKDLALRDSSFNLKIMVLGSHGSCSASDSTMLHILIPAFDFAEKSASIHLGKNGPFNNKCASIEVNEPYPNDGGCQTDNNWCYDGNNPGIINNTLWFNFFAPLNGLINIVTEGFDNRIALYRANVSDDLFSTLKPNFPIAANDNISASETAASLKDVKVEAGKKYWLQVDGYKKASGEFYITLFNNDLEIYPNPSVGVVYFQLARNQSSSGTIEIYSSMGSVVYKSAIENSSDKVLTSVNINGYAPGIYTAVITLGSNRYIKKMVLLRAK